jgi:hypothetical protein
MELKYDASDDTQPGDPFTTFFDAFQNCGRPAALVRL